MLDIRTYVHIWHTFTKTSSCLLLPSPLGHASRYHPPTSVNTCSRLQGGDASSCLRLSPAAEVVRFPRAKHTRTTRSWGRRRWREGTCQSNTAHTSRDSYWPAIQITKTFYNTHTYTLNIYVLPSLWQHWLKLHTHVDTDIVPSFEDLTLHM